MLLACRIFFLLTLVGVGLSIARCSGSDNGGAGTSSPPSSPPSPVPAPSNNLRLQLLSSVLTAPEGLLCFDPPNGCNTTGLTLPVLDYTHDAGACAIIGGYVYRGSAIPNLQGTYFYGDLCARFVRSFRYVNGQVIESFNWASLQPAGSITSFGEDNDGELYILGGALYRIVQM